MKKITLLCLFMLPLIGFSQAVNERIQNYLNIHHSEFGLTEQDITGWIIESQANSKGTKIDNYYIKQRHNGIEIFNAITNVWVKNGEILNIGNRFVPNAAGKANSIVPAISVTEGLSSAFSAVGQSSSNFQVIESSSPRNFTISNGTLTEDPVTAELVYQLASDGSLKLAWDYMF
ncbi:MAG TPA: peptidase M36, partial [Flavobacterium sp.]